jgi:uncharacterized membrane protein YfcA
LASLLSALFYAAAGVVNWPVALLLTSGSVVGSLWGSRVALGPRAQQWIYRLLLITISGEIVVLVWQRWHGMP